MGCYIWYSEEGPGRAAAPPSPLLAVPNVTAHPSTAGVPITVLLYDGRLLCGFNVAIFEDLRDNAVYLFVCLSVCLSICRVHKRGFLKNLSTLELWSLLVTNRKSYMGFSNSGFLDPEDDLERQLTSPVPYSEPCPVPHRKKNFKKNLNYALHKTSPRPHIKRRPYLTSNLAPCPKANFNPYPTLAHSKCRAVSYRKKLAPCPMHSKVPWKTSPPVKFMLAAGAYSLRHTC